MDGPDFDALFGNTGDVTSSPAIRNVPHPALLHVVDVIVANSSPRLIECLVGNPRYGDLGEHFMSAITALEHRSWGDCNMAAAMARIEVWKSLDSEGRWIRDYLRDVFVVVELLLALCLHAEGDAVAAVQHVDYALMFVVPSHTQDGSFDAKAAAMLFMGFLDEAATALQEFDTTLVGSIVFPDPLPQHNRSSLPFAALKVPHVAAPDLENFSDLLRNKLPFVAGGLIESWPARRSWRQLTYLDTAAGHHVVPVELDGAADDVYHQDEWVGEPMPIGEFLRKYLVPSCAEFPHENADFSQAMSAQFTPDVRLLELCPALRADVPSTPEIWRRALCRHKQMNVWLATSGASTWRRIDRKCDALVAQIHGATRFFLLEPGVAATLADNPAIGIVSADFDGVPPDIQAKAQVVDLEPGDTIYVPQNWLHQVSALSPSCCVTTLF